jgi:hypothetical protein
MNLTGISINTLTCSYSRMIFLTKFLRDSVAIFRLVQVAVLRYHSTIIMNKGQEITGAQVI